ncbi:hypothetical protein ACQ4LE_002087 [Meloidogyne hapla]
MTAEIVSERGQFKLNHNGFLYLFQTTSRDGNSKFWRCEFFGSKDVKCLGRIHTDLVTQRCGSLWIHCEESRRSVMQIWHFLLLGTIHHRKPDDTEMQIKEF